MFNIFNKNKEAVKLFYNTDVHCHILPGVDHGSRNVEDSLAMLRAEREMGINRIICTSHVTEGSFENTRESLTAAGEVLKAAIDEAGLDMEIHVSAEYRLDDYFKSQYEQDALLPMPGNFLLLENSFHQELMSLDQLIFDLQVKGYRLIFAHPERYPYYYNRRERYELLHRYGVKFQVNILSLAGYFGGGARDAARWLVEKDYVDMLGSDMHGMDHAATIQKYLRSKDWRKIAERLEGRLQNDMVR